MRSTAGGAVSSWIVVWSMPNHAWRTSWSSRSSRSLSPTSTTTTWALIASRPDVSVHTCRSCTPHAGHAQDRGLDLPEVEMGRRALEQNVDGLPHEPPRAGHDDESDRERRERVGDGPARRDDDERRDDDPDRA